jgi:hypothetical protein
MYIIRNRIFYLDCFTASQFAMTGQKHESRSRHPEGASPEQSRKERNRLPRRYAARNDEYETNNLIIL